MRVFIDGKPADVKIENEKTVGEVIAALEAWLSGSGIVLSGLSVDGKAVDSDGGAGSAENLMNIEIAKAEEIAVWTTPAAKLTLQALIEAKNIFDNGAESWNDSSAASFLREKESALFLQIETALSQNKKFDFMPVIEEREKELLDGSAEFLSLEYVINDNAAALENFALDLQMGKDRQAAETVRNFAFLTSKLFRLLPILRYGGVKLEELEVDENFFNDFNTALNEFFEAYENADTVLAGDLAEYEVSPRLKDFYNALKKQIDKSNNTETA